MPYQSYEETGWSLYPGHPGHLGNQFYREGKTLLMGGWRNHPASKMWYNYRYSLCDYLIVLYHILKERDINDYKKHYEEIKSFQKTLTDTGKPQFIGNKQFHLSHQSNLLRKDKEKGWNWYIQFGWDIPDNLPYIWEI
jgi:hypothetical protein